jgi:hypothetical protein
MFTFHDSALHFLSHHSHLSLLFLLNGRVQCFEGLFMIEFHVINLALACSQQDLSALLSHLLLDNGVLLAAEDLHLLRLLISHATLPVQQ